MAKQILQIKTEVINKNTNKNGGNVQLAVDVKAAPDPGKATARKVVNFQTTSISDLVGFDPGDKVTITFEK